MDKIEAGQKVTPVKKKHLIPVRAGIPGRARGRQCRGTSPATWRPEVCANVSPKPATNPPTSEFTTAATTLK
jgi:hypothetical protein